jgi:murein DD-endopeptidase MepM/ murein hydrolase activator NlpD
MLLLLITLPAHAAALDCPSVYRLHAQSLVGAVSVSADAVADLLAACDGDAPARAPAAAPPTPTYSARAPSAGAADRCDQARQNQALLLSMGVEDRRFDHLLAECESGGGDLFGGASGVSDAGYDLSRVTSGYGWRTHPIRRTRSFHAGLDISARAGDPVTALAGGVITYAGRRGGYGKLVEVEHPVTGLRTRYAHNSRLLVRRGDVVTTGQLIARAGSTGASTGPHVHIEVLSGDKSFDPTPYVREPTRLMRF